MKKLQFDETQSRIRQKLVFSNRLTFAMLIILVFFTLILGRMIYLQWLNHEQYLGLAEGNRVSVEPIAPERGKIYDRNRTVLADNTPVFSLMFQKDQLYNIEKTLEQIQQVLPDIPANVLSRFDTQIKQSSRY